VNQATSMLADRPLSRASFAPTGVMRNPKNARSSGRAFFCACARQDR
jgi:hypothetical protein